MKTIQLDTYPRRDHFRHFLAMANPFVTVNARVDITDWLKRLKTTSHPFFLCFQYAVIHACNKIPEFRQRIVADGIVEYDFCRSSHTVALPDGTYRYCNLNEEQPLEDYIKEGKRKQEIARHLERLEEEGDVASLIFISCLPWLDYASVQMPYPDNRFSIPSICWSKYSTEQGRTTITVTVMVNHALVDGWHISRFYKELEKQLNDMFR